ncbi:MAG TPA: hypothetical protein VHP58_06240 [Alphaproteobacteria bacterium]|nr:hypothetical protein [Alphaproteobacteria bacterium]
MSALDYYAERPEALDRILNNRACISTCHTDFQTLIATPSYAAIKARAKQANYTVQLLAAETGTINLKFSRLF